MKLTVIGDVHGKINEYKKIIDNCKFSICVGDFGFRPEWSWLIKQKNNSEDPWNHWINMGNHDYIPFYHVYGPSMKNHVFWPKESIFTVRGAESIDKHHRIEGLDWFANEELTYQEGLEAFDCYVESKPKIVISHDCPQSVMNHFWKYSWTFGKSNTRNLLEAMFDAHKPDIWIFGHHHESKDEVINGTRFICLDELETFEIEI